MKHLFAVGSGEILIVALYSIVVVGIFAFVIKLAQSKGEKDKLQKLISGPYGLLIALIVLVPTVLIAVAVLG